MATLSGPKVGVECKRGREIDGERGGPVVGTPMVDGDRGCESERECEGGERWRPEVVRL